jgi:hypothetical protein
VRGRIQASAREAVSLMVSGSDSDLSYDFGINGDFIR